MKFKLPPTITVYCLLSLAFAQTQKPSHDLPSSTFKLRSVTVIGTSRYQPADIMRAANLRLGQPFHADDLKGMVRLLGESGAFADVSYTSQFDSDGAHVKLKLRDADRFFPVHFDNVVWFSERELLEKLHASVPLFDGQLPVNGALAGKVFDALQLLLMQRNVAGQVEYLRPFEEDNPVPAFAFTVSGPNITIRNVAFPGAGPSELPKLTAAAKKLQGAEYAHTAIRNFEEQALLPVYREHGYLRAAFSDPEPTVVEDDGHDTLVDVVVPVKPGRQYRLAGIQISGNKALPDATLRAAFHIQAGEVANALELEKDLEAVRQICRTRGYMVAAVKAELQMDDSRSSVTDAVSIVEGDVYKMGEVEIRGLDTRTTARLQNDWRLRTGDTYDAGYVGRFVEQAYKEVGNWRANVRESVDPRTKTVDVTVRFDPPPDIPAFDRSTEY